MAYPRNDQIQYAIVDYLKNGTACSTVRAELSDTDEIREDQWQGTAFSYPAVRVRLMFNKPKPPADENCSHANIRLSIEAYSEDDSSQEADRISGIIHNVLHARQFSNQSVNLFLRTINLIPARRLEEHVWKAECMMEGTASIG